MLSPFLLLHGTFAHVAEDCVASSTKISGALILSYNPARKSARIPADFFFDFFL